MWVVNMGWEVLMVYSGTPLNRHPSTADTHDITDNSESLDYPSIHFNILKQPLNSGHPATLYNRQFLQSRLYANNPDLADTHRPFQQDCPLSLL